MNIVDFLNRFNDVISYSFELSIGGLTSDDIKVNKDLISVDNFKGKMIRFYETKYGKMVKYVPINTISLPILKNTKALIHAMLRTIVVDPIDPS